MQGMSDDDGQATGSDKPDAESTARPGPARRKPRSGEGFASVLQNLREHLASRTGETWPPEDPSAGNT